MQLKRGHFDTDFVSAVLSYTLSRSGYNAVGVYIWLLYLALCLPLSLVPWIELCKKFIVRGDVERGCKAIQC